MLYNIPNVDRSSKLPAEIDFLLILDDIRLVTNNTNLSPFFPRYTKWIWTENLFLRTVSNFWRHSDWLVLFSNINTKSNMYANVYANLNVDRKSEVDSFEEMSGVVEVTPMLAGGYQGARLRHVCWYVVIRLLERWKYFTDFLEAECFLTDWPR